MKAKDIEKLLLKHNINCLVELSRIIENYAYLECFLDLLGELQKNYNERNKGKKNG